MKLTFLFLLVTQISFTATAQKLTPEQWKEDIDFFARQLVKKHKNPFHTTKKEDFERSVIQLRNSVDSLPDYKIMIRMLQITASVGDGHTYVHLPATVMRYPVILYWFGDDLFVVRATQEYKQAIGKRISKIAGLPIDEVKKKISTVLSRAENKWFDLFNSAMYIILPEVLVTLGIVPALDKATFTLLDENNKESEVELKPLIPGSKPEWLSAAKEEPLFRQRASETFWFTYLPEINAVYVNFKIYDDLRQNVNKLFAFIDENKATRLIIDIRQNGGGDFTKVRRAFIPAIQKHPTINQKGNLFVITGRRTFSAAMVNAIDFKKETNATIIGEPPGERPNSYSENNEMKLPNSGLVVSYSTRYYKFLDQDVPAFMPDIQVDPNWQDYVAGIDPVMERIKSMINKK